MVMPCENTPVMSPPTVSVLPEIVHIVAVAKLTTRCPGIKEPNNPLTVNVTPLKLTNVPVASIATSLSLAILLVPATLLSTYNLLTPSYGLTELVDMYKLLMKLLPMLRLLFIANAPFNGR